MIEAIVLSEEVTVGVGIRAAVRDVMVFAIILVMLTMAPVGARATEGLVESTAGEMGAFEPIGESEPNGLSQPTLITVTFDARGGTVVDAVTLVPGSAVGTLATPQRTGYTFDGWFLAPAGGAKLKPSFQPTGDITLFAQWTAKNYTIKYYHGTTLLKTVTLPYDAKLKPDAAPKKTGYQFVGWYSARSGGELVERVSGNLSVYARYRIRFYEISYYSHKGALLETVSTKYDTAPMAGPKRTGYTFAGWYSAKTGGVKVTKISKSQNLYARYTIKQYTTTYYVSGALYRSVKANYNTAVIAGPKKTGYTFVGWYTAKTGGEQVTKASKNQSLYARYKIKQYTVNYYVGSTLLLTEQAKYNTALRKDIVPAKTGYTFRGWYTAKTGGTKVARLTKNLTVYARYRIIPHNLCQTGTKGLTGLEKSLKAKTLTYSGTYSIYVKNLNTNEYCMINNQAMYPASLIKLYSMACVYEGYESGTLSKNVQMQDWVNSSITVSSNDAYNLLLNQIGGGDTYRGIDRLNAYCQKQGYTQTACHGSLGPTSLPYYTKGVAQTSVKDTAHILEDMYRGTLVSPAASAEMLGILKRQQRTWKIPAGLPAGVVTANKTGEVVMMEHDAAIVFSKNADYIIVVMSANDGAAIHHIRELSAIAYSYFNK